jgi:tetratricopeptide (TPR) repeat protein
MRRMSASRPLRALLAAVLFCIAGVEPASAAASPRREPAASVAVTVEHLVAAAIAGDHARLREIASELKSRPRPPRGDRRLARDLNERGLALWRRHRFSEAAVYFGQAHQADASDAEIAENLGYALLKSGRLKEAEVALLAALTLAPERASAWGSLGLLRAKAGSHREGVACVLTAYRFVRDRQRTLEVYTHLAATDDDPKVRALLADVVKRLSTRQPESKSS